MDGWLAELQQPPLVILEHELTYINHIPQGEGWETLEDLADVLPIFAASSEQFRFLPHPKNLAWNMRFDFPDELGRLDVKLSQGVRRTDKHPILLLQLTARGKASGPSWESSRIWYETAHNWIVNGFTDITTPKIQQLWEREGA